MRFYKDCEGFCFFLSVHLIFFIQIYLIYNIDDTSQDNNNVILFCHKLSFYILIFLTFITHFKIAKTDPGIINYYNNIDMLEFYYFLYHEIIELKEEYNLKYNVNINLYKEKNNYSSDEEENMECKSIISDKIKRIISKKLKIGLTRCRSCYVVRPYDSHHCKTCHSCVLEEDHHCPWINNCIGIFNKKYFILFNLYAFLSVIYCSWIYYYYTVYINYKFFVNNIKQNLVAIFWGIFAFIYGLFVLIMLIEQRDNVINEFKIFKKDKEIQNKLIKMKMRIIFGGNFSIKWFFPFTEGGKRYLFFYLRHKKMELYLNRKESNDLNTNVNNNNDNNDDSNNIKEKEKEE